MIIRILTGVDKRVEDMNETLNTEISNNTAERKFSIKEIRNLSDGMNSRLEEAEEWISDPEDSVMESNQALQKKEKIIMENKNRVRELSDSNNVITFVWQES